MDDIITFNKTWIDHLKTLTMTLETLRKNGLKANPAKCEYGFSQIEFLGFKIKADGIQISDRKIKAIKAIVAPKTKKSLQRLLGLRNFWRRFVKNFTINTYNMRKLLRKNEPFIWSASCQVELEYLKECLISDPILRPFDLNKDIVIMCDASEKLGYGFSLMQHDDNKELFVVAYGAQALTKAQERYPASELELIALVLALKQFEC